MISEAVIDDIKHRLNIVDIISDRIEIKKAGKNWFGRCPFHDEKSASFSVNEQKQMAYCFGCGAGGDVFKFVMDYENIDFYTAVRKLAAIAGVSLDETQQEKPIVSKRKMSRLESQAMTEKIIIELYEGEIKKGNAVNDEDEKRYQLAVRRLNEIKKMKLNY